MNRGIDMVRERALEDVNPSPHPAFRRVVGAKPVGNRRCVELRRPAIRAQPVGPLHPIAAHAVELAAEHRRAPFLGRHPRPHRQRRPVTHVLTMAAVEIRNPVAMLVEMETRDRALHGLTNRVPRAIDRATRSRREPFGAESRIHHPVETAASPCPPAPAHSNNLSPFSESHPVVEASIKGVLVHYRNVGSGCGGERSGRPNRTFGPNRGDRDE